MKFCGSQVPAENMALSHSPNFNNRGFDLLVRFSLIVFHFMESNGD